MSCILAGEVFEESKKECYNYETLGGNHSRAALQALCEEETTPHAAFRARLVSVYSRLTDEEAQRLASRHNHATSLQHKMSSWEKVQHACMHDYHHLNCPIQCLQIQFCRNSLYKLTNTPYDAQTPTKPKNWRGYCARLLMDEVYTCIYHTG